MIYIKKITGTVHLKEQEIEGFSRTIKNNDNILIKNNRRYVEEGLSISFSERDNILNYIKVRWRFDMIYYNNKPITKEIWNRLEENENNIRLI